VNQYVNPANAMTASRFLTIPPLIYCVDQGLYQYASVLMLICAMLDVFDGKVAKLLNCTSQFGEVFDAVADAVCYGTFFITLAVYEWLPRAPVAIIVGVGALNIVMRAAYARRAGKAVNYRSWAMERVVGYGCFVIGAGLCRYEVHFYSWALCAVMVAVLAHDSKRMLVDPVTA
jgi:phosphatidylglycerophosphate synthase